MQKIKQNNYSKACGKVLIGGGYGVLQKNNIGLCLALQNYFYCQIKLQQNENQNQINVNSPQIHKKYSYDLDKNTLRFIQKNNKQNVFVQNAINFTLNHLNVLQKKFGKIQITILFDKGFISQKSIQKQHNKFPVYLQNYSKTGLGSSACVTVSIVSALCQIFCGQLNNRNLINVISHVANLSAQKKIGSNFDISTAVYGTHLYKNILPQKAYQFIEQKDLSQLINIDPQIISLCNVNKLIKQNCIAYMIDVSKGANTRSMVSNFLSNLKKHSEQIVIEFYKQSKQITNNLYNLFICEQVNNFKQIKKRFLQINQQHRKLQQKYSHLTKTSVEPQQFTFFLNQIMENQHVIYLICPGSGGYDAIFMLCQKINQNQQLCKSYYQNLIDKSKQENAQSLGDDFNFILKEVSIKWDGQIVVNQKQIQEIQKYIQKIQKLE